MGIVSQDFKLLRDRTVNANVAFALEITGHARKEAKNRASEVLRRVGLEDREGDSILSLSAGEKQRVAIARAVVHSPPLLIADEPTGNLDAKMILDVMEIFTDLHQKGTTIVFSTQFTGLVKHYPYRVIQILNGRISDGRRVDIHQEKEVKAGE
jgi:cell division transport system ATP-binding protein